MPQTRHFHMKIGDCYMVEVTEAIQRQLNNSEESNERRIIHITPINTAPLCIAPPAGTAAIPALTKPPSLPTLNGIKKLKEYAWNMPGEPIALYGRIVSHPHIQENYRMRLTSVTLMDKKEAIDQERSLNRQQVVTWHLRPSDCRSGSRILARGRQHD